MEELFIGQEFDWNISALFRTDDKDGHLVTSGGYALIILNTPLENDINLQALWANSCIHVAADGGANRLFDVIEKPVDGIPQADGSIDRPYSDLQVIIGDLDSLREDVRNYFESLSSPAQVIFDPDQESTDFGKAVSYIRKTCAADIDIVAVGSLGGRVDQGLSQLHHLYLFQDSPDYAAGRVYLVTNQSLTFLLKTGKHRIRLRDDNDGKVFDKYVGIIPIKEPSVITTRGLEWDVEDWETQFGGKVSTSNHVLPDVSEVIVETTKDVVFTIALRRGIE